jgi:hypothetical protein
VKKKQSFMAVFVFIIIILLLTFLIFTGCRKARVERLQNLKESSVSSKQTTSQDENNESGDKMVSTETGESKVTTAEITEDSGEVLASEDSASQQNEEEIITAEANEAEETALEDEEETETAAETIQLTKDFTNLQMEGGTLHSDFFASAGIGAGDFSNNKEARGFASFDISGISGANILEASIKATALEKYGEPFNNYGPIIIKGVYWGPAKINPSYFNIDGIELANYSAKNFTINNSILIDDLQRAINNGSPRYQICLYFEMNQTNGDNIQDCVAYAWDGITLHVTYTTIAAADQ